MPLSSVLGPWIRSRHGYAVAVVLTATLFAAAGPAAAEAAPVVAAGAAAQRPISASAFMDRATAAAWRTVPSWVLIAAHDKSIAPDLERFEAERARSHTVEVDSSHVAMITHPDAVTDLIVEEATGAQTPAKANLADRSSSRTRALVAGGGIAVAAVLTGAGLVAVSRKRRNSVR
ncbi:alpha/beta fold hydrolase [Streptomyces sp. NPDC001820]|uniref:alpha/beta fold hydrolase n=1 Tax=Streptomyces sp. NPDC001820 TaxID=3364613 RepID=UPI0036A45756